MSENPKVIVIGLDGATWDLIKPWADEGKLPTLKGLICNGAYATLKSTVPSYTLPAWTSLITGVNQGKHRIYDLFVENEENLRLVSSKDRRAKSIFQILSGYDRTSVAVNIPGTFPPDRIKGAMISGTLTTPTILDKFIYPEDLKEDLADFFTQSFELDYVLAKYLTITNKNELINRLNETAESEINATIKLIERFKPDILWYVFRTTDIVQHYLYDSKAKSKNHECLIEHYQKVDTLIKKIFDSYSDDWAAFIVSDHGFAPIKKYIYLNNWLEKKGLLERKRRDYASLSQSIAKFGGEIIKLLAGKINLIDKAILKILKMEYSVKTIKNITSNASIDFSKTKAYCPSYTSQAVKIIAKNDEAEKSKIVNEIISELYKLRDPESGQQVVEKVYKREDIYSGNYVSDAPDILVTTKEGYILTNMFSQNDDSVSHPPTLLGVKTGDHRPEGVFIASGSGINNVGLLDTISVYDIAPTIFYFMGIPIPSYMDGRPVKEIFTEEVAASQLISRSEKERIRDKIKDLREREQYARHKPPT